MKHVILISLLSLSLVPGCGVMSKLQRPKPAATPEVQIAPPVATTTLAPVMGQAASPAALDQATAEQKQAAVAKTGVPEQKLGTAVVALGNPVDQGFWVKAAVIKTAGKGRVVTANGASVNVDLIPATGAASLSFSAFRALGLGLTDLPEVTIYAN
jgi:hypothetical protein